MEILLRQNQATARSTSISLGLVALLSFFVMTFIMGLVKIYSPDLGFHLKSAEWIVNNKQFIYTDSFSLSSEGRRYFDLQWLYQVFIYFLYNRGESVLIIVNALLITVSLMLVWMRFSKNTAVDRIGDLVVLGDSVTVFGELDGPEENLPNSCRTHGSEYEIGLPLMILNGGELPAKEYFRYNKDLVRWLWEVSH